MRNISEVYLFNQINKIYKLSPLSPKEIKGDNLCISLDNCVERKQNIISLQLGKQDITVVSLSS